MGIMQWFLVIVTAIILLPVIAYLVVKFGATRFYRAKNRYKKQNEQIRK